MTEVIAKSSASKLEQLSAEEIAEIEEELHCYNNNQRAVVIDALKIVQKHRGWVSDDMVKAIASFLDLSPAVIDGVATFFNLIYRRPVGKKVISICNSVSCWIMGQDNNIEFIREKLKIKFGQTTTDGEYTLIPIACLGDCDRAPVMMINEDMHRNISPQSLDKILDGGK